MPINLNALLRYKTIDKCLQNRYRPATIDYLIERCSEALTDKNGVVTGVSERTIREDIRVLRSNLLEFNAPIICQGGVYFYEDKDYSIFNQSIRDLDLLLEIQEFLEESYDNLPENRTLRILESLSVLTGKELRERFQSTSEMMESRSDVCGAPSPPPTEELEALRDMVQKSFRETKTGKKRWSYFSPKKQTAKEKTEPIFDWNAVFSLLN